MILRIDSALSLDFVHRNRRCAPHANRSKCGSASALISLCWHRSLLKALPLFHSPCMMMMMMMTTQRHNMRSTKFLLPGPWLDVKTTSDWRTLKRLLASSFWTPHAKGFCDGWQRMVRCSFRRAETMECCSSHQGQPLQASHRLLFPAALGEACVVIAPCILDAQIPCLASRTLLTDVGAAIDLGKHVVHFTKLNTWVNLQIVNGHVGINIADFSNSPQALQLWNVFCHDCLKEGNQHRHEEYINLTPLASQSTLADASSAESFISQFRLITWSTALALLHHG